ncbi:crossover junction endodeoxyribonuclease [Candidatus Pacearchaeota archaeon]|nr:crossover junction endodeoxyribonuclease [Candidatus Pacearchaeota archaeon]
MVVSSTGEAVTWQRMPIMDSGSKGRTKKKVDAGLLAEFVKRFRPSKICCEKVSSMPGQGVAGMFSFGRSFGVVDGIAGALNIPITYVIPTVWKRHFALLKKDKKQSIILANIFLYEQGIRFMKVADEGVAESFLIARYDLDRILGILRQ